MFVSPFELPSIQVTTEHWVEFPVLYSKSSLAIYFIYSIKHTCVKDCFRFRIKDVLTDPTSWLGLTRQTGSIIIIILGKCDLSLRCPVFSSAGHIEHWHLCLFAWHLSLPCWALGWASTQHQPESTGIWQRVTQTTGLPKVALVIKNPPANAGDIRDPWVWSLGREDPLEKEGMAIHSSILAWRIPWTEEPGRTQSMGSQRVEHDEVT